MNARVAAILVVLLAVLGGGALLYQQQERARRPENVGDARAARCSRTSRPPTSPRSSIVEPKATLTLQRKDERWVIAERGDFPADLAKVREFVLKVIGLKVGQSEPLGEKDRARLNLDASGTQVEFNGADGKTLGALHRRQEVLQARGGEPGEGDRRRPLRRPARTRPSTAYLVGDPLAQATAKTAEWIDRSSFQVEKVKTLEVRYPGRRRLAHRARRPTTPNGSWPAPSRARSSTFQGPTPRPTRSRCSSSPTSRRRSTATRASTSRSPIDATTLEGATYAIKVGKLAGDNYYVTFTASGLKPDAKDAERVKLLSQHVLLIPKSKLEDTLKKRAELLEKKARQEIETPVLADARPAACRR